MSEGVAETQVRIEPRHLAIVRDIVRSVVPDRKVWVFGSRATGVRLKPFSDLDLAVSGRLSIAEAGALATAFDESLLPMKVDVVALGGVSADFRERIAADFISLTD